MQTAPGKSTFGLRLIAILEALKGALALALALGFFVVAGHHLNPLIHAIVERFRLDDSAHAPHLIVEMLTGPEQFPFAVWTALSVAYATLRFTEAYGLWLVSLLVANVAFVANLSMMLLRTRGKRIAAPRVASREIGIDAAPGHSDS